MTIQLPPELDELRSFLVRDAKMTTVSTEQPDGFGNVCMVMKGGTVQIRYVKDRGQWNVELSPTDTSEQWYDVLILREMLTGARSDEPLPLAHEVQILMGNWSIIMELFSPARFNETKRTLQKLMDDRARRMFPGWYH